MLDYLKRHHIGLLALFIALGGTSYAAAKLPHNSVGTAQLRKGAVTTAKLSHSVQAKLAQAGKAGPAGAKGDTGAQGPQGVPGAAGEAGVQGPQGVPGPTSAGVGGFNTTVSPGPWSASVGSSTSVTLDRPGKVLVQLLGTFGVTCGGSCSRTIGVAVDGHTVPGAFATLNGTGNGTIATGGLLADVAAGTHTVSAMEKTSGTATPAGTDIRVVAIALGG
jgi:hypothetical protein